MKVEEHAAVYVVPGEPHEPKFPALVSGDPDRSDLPPPSPDNATATHDLVLWSQVVSSSSSTFSWLCLSGRQLPTHAASCLRWVAYPSEVMEEALLREDALPSRRSPLDSAGRRV